MTLFSEKVLISIRRISGLMSNLIKKSWTDSNLNTQGKRDQNSVMHFLLRDMLYEDINETLMLKKSLVIVFPIFLHKISHSYL